MLPDLPALHCKFMFAFWYFIQGQKAGNSIFLVKLYSRPVQVAWTPTMVSYFTPWVPYISVKVQNASIHNFAQFCIAGELWVRKIADYLTPKRKGVHTGLQGQNSGLSTLIEKGVFTFVCCKYRTDAHSAKAFYVNKPCISRHLINWRSVSVHIIKVSEISRITLECCKLAIKATQQL